jgi:hypothetical protein
MRLWLLLFFTAKVYGYIKGFSFYGIETELRNNVCSWVNPPEYYISFLKDLGFNSIRVPFSLQYVEEGNWGNLDKFLAVASRFNMSVLLDCHRTFSNHQDFSPYEHDVSHQRFINGWLNVLERYSTYDNIIGTNVYNEYQGLDYTFLNGYSEEVVSAIEAVYPNRYVFHITGTNWAGTSHLVSLDHLPFHDRIYYSLHKYVFSSNGDYENDWEHSCGNHSSNRIVIGEFGWLDNDAWWGHRFISWLKKKGIRDTFFCTIALSDGTGGLWFDDCITFNWSKFAILKMLWDDIEDKPQRYLRRNEDNDEIIICSTP